LLVATLLLVGTTATPVAASGGSPVPMCPSGCPGK